MSLCKDCVTGARHEGNPEGKNEKIGGVECYIATPAGDYPKDVAIVFLTDVFGLNLSNNLLLADDFARNGFKVVVPDLFNGDPVHTDALSGAVPFDRQTWSAKHPVGSVASEIVNPVLNALEAKGITRFGYTGYCFGARPAFDLAFAGKATVVAVSHPSRLEIPGDFERYKDPEQNPSKAPLLINSCEFDTSFPLDGAAQVDVIMKDFAPGYKREYFEGCKHGFAVRGDMSDPKVKAGKEGAFTSTALWFKEHLLK